MRILGCTTAGAGHFGPLVPFLEAIRRAGHEVRVAAPPSFTGVVERDGFTAWPLTGADEGVDERQAVFARLDAMSNDDARRALVWSEIFGRTNTTAALPSMRQAVRDWSPDFVLRESAEFSSWVAAEEAGVPHAQVVPGLASSLRWLPAATRAIAPLRTACGLPSDPDGTGIRRAPMLTLTPRSLEDPAAPGPSTMLRARTPQRDHAPLPDHWKGATDPLVYVTFGTVALSMEPLGQVLQEVVQAVSELSARILVTVGDQADPSALGPLPPNVHVEQWVPQVAVMPHASAVISHGGYGTILAALTGGVPQVVVPFFADQPENAARVAAVGAGQMIPPGAALGERVRTALDEVLTTLAFRECAARTARDIAALSSVDEVVGTLLRPISRQT